MTEFLHRILRKWYVYLLAVAVGVFAASYWVDYVTKPVKEETISLFLGTYTSNSGISEVRKELKSGSPSYLKEINITAVAPDDSDFAYYFVNNGLNKADIFVLPESILTEDMLNKQFASLDEEYVSGYFAYESESTGHGIVIHEQGSDDDGLLQFTNGGEDENFYLFFRVNSLHIGKMNDSDYDTALLFAKVLLGYE